jgi:hypothetical protein
MISLSSLGALGMTFREGLALTMLALASLPAQGPPSGAPLDVTAFRYARDLPAGSGLTMVTLDAAALAHGRVGDIRIVDGARRQIPYVIERADSTIVLALSAPRPASAETNVDRRLPRDASRRTWYRIDLPFTGVPDATLVLETDARVFRREITVIEGGALDLTYRRVMNESWSHDDPATAAPSLEVSLPSRLRSDSLFVLIGDGDNDKLPITKATLRLPTYTLRFFRESGSPLRMVYGRPDLAAPRYDLELVAGRLKDSSAAEVALGAERAVDDPAGKVPGVVFWSLLVGTVLIMLLLIGRLLRGDGGQAADAAPAPPAAG